MATRDPVDIDRLLDRVLHYAKAGGASEKATRHMIDMLQSAEGKAVLHMPAEELDSLLVNDVYKIRMQNVYSHYMTGVTADFALKIRRCKADVNSKHVLGDMRQEQPEIYSALMTRVCSDLQHMDALDPRVLAALQEYHAGYEPPGCMMEQLSGTGAGRITWTDVEGSPIAIGSGPIAAASNTETSCMQATQASIIAAAAASRSAECTAAAANAHLAAGSSSSSSSRVFVFDRTERLANSLGRMVGIVEQINNIPHDFDIMLMAGRRSTDLLHLLLQNLYFMKHVRNYIGTSSVLAAALFRPMLQRLGYSQQQRQQLVKGLLGTHAHEMTSVTQQLLVKYDEEAGRRCGFNVPICITQLLAHLLFLVTNGDQRSRTALPDTFTTSYFITLAMLTQPPAEFVEDMQQQWGVKIEAEARVFDIFSVWRLDSGDYPALAQVLYDSWQQRNTSRAAAGLDPLPPLQIIQSNIDTVDDIRSLADLPDQIRPHVLGFGGLADGFLAFDPVRSENIGQVGRSGLGAAEAPAGSSSKESERNEHEHLELPVCSLVMKAVQARLSVRPSSSSSRSITASSGRSIEAHANSNNRAAARAALDHDHSSDAAAESDEVYEYASPNAVTGGGALSSSRSSRSSITCKQALLLGSLQETAVKIGDDGGLGKAQVDPRLPRETQTEVLTRVQAMIDADKELQGLGEEKSGVLSAVLREAYVAVVREGLLNAPAAK